MLQISTTIHIPADEIQCQPIRAQGAGGQNVNKVSSAIHLRFDVLASSLPEDCKARVLALSDQRISADGIITIKAQRFRTQARNRDDALARLAALIQAALVVPKTRQATRPSRAAKQRRMAQKSRRGEVKALRGKPEH